MFRSQVAEALKVKGLVEENRSGSFSSSNDEPMDHSPSGISTSGSNVVHSSSNNNSPPHSTSNIHYKTPYGYGGTAKGGGNGDRRMNMPLWAVPGLPIPSHSNSVPNQNHPHAAATAAAAMLSSCYEAASDMSPLRRKKLSSLLMNRDTPILRTVLGQGQADSSQPVSLVCHPDSHEQHSSVAEQDHRIEKVGTKCLFQMSCAVFWSQFDRVFGV